MSRLTDSDYIKTRHKLRRMWLHDPGIFGYVSPREQWDLHDFFQPAEDLSDVALLEHREVASTHDPSLPQRAGRALSYFYDKAASASVARLHRAPATTGAGRVKQQDRKLSVRVVVRPKIDTKKLSRAFINLAIDLAKQRGAEDERSDGRAASDERPAA